MPSYRLYILDRFSGHIEAVEEVVSADDVGAICLVQERGGDVPMELWQGGRKVRHFDAPPATRFPPGAGSSRAGGSAAST
jgi:hypothetical protein